MMTAHSLLPSRRGFMAGSTVAVGTALIPRYGHAYFPGLDLLVSAGFLLISTLVVNIVDPDRKRHREERRSLRREHYLWLREKRRRRRQERRSMLGRYGSEVELDLAEATHGIHYDYPQSHGGPVDPLSALGLASLYYDTKSDECDGRAAAPLYYDQGRKQQTYNGCQVYQCQEGDRWLRRELAWTETRVQRALVLVKALEQRASFDAGVALDFGLDDITRVLARLVVFESMHT